jgi:hypothetical protein
MTFSGMGPHLGDGLSGGYLVLGFGRATGAEEVVGQLLLTRVIEPASKLDILVRPAHVIVPAFG